MAVNVNQKDYARTILVFPRKILMFLSLYPENITKFTNVSFWILLSCATFMEYGQTYYMIDNITDLEKMAISCTTVATTFQAICKLIILYVNITNLKKFLKTVSIEFWPTTFVSQKLQKSIRNQIMLVKLNTYVIYGIAIVFAIEFISLGFMSKERTLPFVSKFPFDWTVSPVYEIIFISQVLTNICININSILGHDFLFYALTISVICQFRLLKYVMREIGGYRSSEMLGIVGKWTREENDYIVKHKNYDDDVKLLRKCIQHHTMLLRCCDDLERIFSVTVFVQYVASALSICVSSFLITLIEKSTISHLISYCFGHVFQLFFYCALGTGLYYQTSEVANAIFESEWYMTKSNQVFKNMIIIIQRSQKEKKITALGLTDLNFVSFIKVLRLSFSFYTLLHTIENK